jgi:oxysterol-binding protein 1
VYVKSKFWGKSLEVHPLGTCHVSLPHKGEMEHYSWKKVTTLVNNLILGKLTIEHYGDMVVKNHRTGEELVLTFKPSSNGWFSGSGYNKDMRALEGLVKDSKGTIRYELKGRWDESLYAHPVTSNGFSKSTFLLWKTHPIHPPTAKNFHFSHLGMLLNQTDKNLDKVLPLTDSRKRPDQRAMELGQWDKADKMKESLENNQRKLRAELVRQYEATRVPSGPPAKGIEIGEKWWSPRWFAREVEKDTKEEHWRYTGEYWNCRKSKWPDYVLDIFGVTS